MTLRQHSPATALYRTSMDHSPRPIISKTAPAMAARTKAQIGAYLLAIASSDRFDMNMGSLPDEPRTSGC
jgi:hypothetical protein